MLRINFADGTLSTPSPEVTGQGPSSRENARDLRKISPGVYPELFEGVEMTKRGPFDVAQDMLCAFAGDMPSFGCGSAALGFWGEHSFTLNLGGA
jgi:hypothetical protein